MLAAGVIFEEARAHLVIETQRQSSERAILRTTPALLGLFSLVTLFAHQLLQGQDMPIRRRPGTPRRCQPSAIRWPSSVSTSGQ